jgi:hypothetical protein
MRHAFVVSLKRSSNGISFPKKHQCKLLVMAVCQGASFNCSDHNTTHHHIFLSIHMPIRQAIRPSEQLNTLPLDSIFFRALSAPIIRQRSALVIPTILPNHQRFPRSAHRCTLCTLVHTTFLQDLTVHTVHTAKGPPSLNNETGFFSGYTGFISG